MKAINKIYNLNTNLNKKIVLISDIHYSDKKDIKRLNVVLEKLRKIKIDYICIPGDLIDKSNIEDEKYIIDWLKELSQLSKVIISIGNHEFYINKHESVFGLNKDFLNKISKIKNLYLLNNECKIIDNINFIGLTVPIENYNSKLNINCINNIKCVNNMYNVLLCHSPEFVIDNNIINNNMDLVLCGHMHGGVVPRFLRPIFKNRGIISPYKTLFPRNVYGLIKKGKCDIVITSGLRALPFKLLNRLFSLEIVEINI